MKCRKLTKEHKANISAALECKLKTEKTKALMSAAHRGENNHNFGKRGEESTNYKGGKKVANARADAKRRKLSHTLIYPVEEGEVGHHVTNEYIIGIPAEVHRHFGGRSRKKHRTLVLQWLKANDKKKYKMVLCVLAKELLY